MPVLLSSSTRFVQSLCNKWFRLLPVAAISRGIKEQPALTSTTRPNSYSYRQTNSREICIKRIRTINKIKLQEKKTNDTTRPWEAMTTAEKPWANTKQTCTRWPLACFHPKSGNDSRVATLAQPTAFSHVIHMHPCNKNTRIFACKTFCTFPYRLFSDCFLLEEEKDVWSKPLRTQT